MEAIQTKTHSAVPPCEKNCSMYALCKARSDMCQQRNHWDATGVINIELCRVPSQMKSKPLVAVKIGRPKRIKPDHKMLIKQLRVKEWLCALKQSELSKLSDICGYSLGTLKQSRSLGRGLSEKFINALHAPKAQSFIHGILSKQEAA